MHWRSFIIGFTTALLGTCLLVVAAAVFYLDQVEIVVPVDVDSYITLVGQEMGAAVSSALPAAIGDVKRQVPEFVAQEMAGIFDNAVLTIGGWKVTIPGHTLSDLEEGLQDVVRSCIYEMLDNIDPDVIAGQLREECEQRLRASVSQFVVWEAVVTIGDWVAIPVRIRSDS